MSLATRRTWNGRPIGVLGTLTLMAMLSWTLAGAGVAYAQENGEPDTAPTSPSEPVAAMRTLTEVLPVIVDGPAAERAFQNRAIAGQRFHLTQFGYDVLAADAFVPSQSRASIPTPSDYRVGPGDEFVIHITGTVFETHRISVNAEGQAMLPKAGPISLSTLTFEQAKRVIAAEVQQFYAGVQVSVALGDPRSIAVFVLGEVPSPGRYDLSGFSTVMHGLLAAGGIEKSGSLRTVQVLRKEQVVAHIDLYDLLLKGTETGDLRLQDGDIIYVPSIGSVVGIAGEVRRPAIYELAPGETLQQLVEFAGGLARSADSENIRVERFLDDGRRSLLEVSVPRAVLNGDATSGRGLDLGLVDYDLVFIPHVDVARLPIRTGEVRVHGNVVRPGVYEWNEEMTVSELLARTGGLLGDSLLYRGEIYRFLSQETRQVIPFDVEAALAGDPDHDVPLNEWDEVHIYSVRDVIPEPSVEIAGQVHEPGTYPLTPDMRVRDLVFRAGEVTEHAHLGRAELFRASRFFPDTLLRVEVIDLLGLLQGDEKQNLVLREDDRLIIYHADDLMYTPKVRISGLVQQSGSFDFTENMRLSDLLARAGGVTGRAVGGQIEIFRLDESGRTETVLVDVEEALSNVLQPTRADVDAVGLSTDPLLREGDRVVVRGRMERITDFTVALTGAVRYPGAYPFAPGDRLADVIARAGGFTMDAYEYGIVVTRASLREQHASFIADLLQGEWEFIERERARLEDMPLTSDERERRWRALEHRAELLRTLEGRTPRGRIILDVENTLSGTAAAQLRLQHGDEVHVPVYPETVIVTGAVYMPEAVLFAPEQTPDYYLQLVGGPTPGASAEDMYVIKANGRVETSGTGFTAVRQGDAIVVPFRTGEEGER